jgi:hypothetical protein
MQHWTQDDFDSMSWHDNHVHGFRLVEGEHGAGTLELDLDYILKWLPAVGGAFQFQIAPAKLVFRDVTNFRMTIDYAGVSAAIAPFSVSGIERSIVQRRHYPAVCWKIPINFPAGEISFEASGFEQRVYGRELLVDRQWLTPSERRS